MHGPTFNALLLVWCAALAAAEPAIPAAMAPKLARITPEMIARITAACPAEPVAKPAQPRKVLIFSRCGEGGDVHESILVSEKALIILGEKTRAYSADASYDYGVFDAARLAPYDALILNNSADIPFPQDAPRQALIDFVRNGKGIVGIHGAAENFNDFPEARKMMGVQFAGHPGPRQGQRR